MANPEHLKILERGVEAWNEWRRENAQVAPDLQEADLRGESLFGADLGGANLGRAKLGGAYLVNANLAAANLRGAALPVADLSTAELSGADLSEVNFNTATLRDASLDRADLCRANLLMANLTGADLGAADFTRVRIGHTTFGDNDLSDVKGLETVVHGGPSTIGIDTIYKSKGKIPEVFLRGCGVPEDFILYMRSLVGKPIEFYSCFISYSSKDDDFAKRLHADLQAQNVRCWFAPEDLKIGDKFRMRIDEAIRLHDKLLLVLSENSVKSAWVEKEVEAAFEKERRQDNKPVLFPIRLDEAVMQTDQAWAADIRRTRHIGDFTRWKDHDTYQQAFQRLLRDLKAEAGSPT
jgi:uncharacterized protein YjbI with pentapeptide repeats